MSPPPDVSIVIPMYNAAEWIEATLRSVAEQRLARERLELIVIDDGSRDDSVQMVASILEAHALEARVIASENVGASAARNKGWKLARADWVQFLDADDLLAPSKLELQVACSVNVQF